MGQLREWRWACVSLVAVWLLAGCGLRGYDVTTNEAEFRHDSPGVDGGSDPFDPVCQDNSGWRQIVAGGAHQCALRDDGVLTCWGANNFGQLGIGSSTGQPDPHPVAGSWRLVDTGEDFTCGLQTDDSLWCWGSNSLGQLGQPGVGVGVLDRPGLVSSDRWLDIGVGTTHACAVRMDGTLWCWGEGSQGRLGIGGSPPTVVDTPTRAGTDSNWASVSGGQVHSCGLKADGALYCWGRGQENQLGLGNRTYADDPTRVGTDSDWTSIEVGREHSCARKKGRLYCWGRSDAGQTGTGETLDVEYPTVVAGDDAYCEHTGGHYHFACAVTAHGASQCWGENTSGEQCRGGDVNDRLVPDQVGTQTDWRHFAAGRLTVCGIRQSGEVHCCNNATGELEPADLSALPPR